MYASDDEEPPELVAVPSERTAKIPVTILTGFLGAGKTTLLRHLLTANHGKRIAIVENEFSSGLGIEGMIAMNGVDGTDMSSFFEVNNGCICCSVKDNLLSTLEQLVLHKDKFDYIIIETTGVANPGPIVSIFWADEGLNSFIKLDGVVCVVDAVNINKYLSEKETSVDVMQQICYADRVLLNKSDLVEGNSLDEIERTVKSINSMAEIQRTTFSTVHPDWVIDIDSYCSRQLWDASTVCGVCSDSSVPLSVNMLTSQNPTSHSANILTTDSIIFSGCLDYAQLARILDDVLYGQKAEISNHHDIAPASTLPIVESNQTSPSMVIYRMKGIVHVAGSPYLHVLQAVHDIFELYPSTYLAGSAVDRTQGKNTFIVIGKNLDKDLLATRLMEAII